MPSLNLCVFPKVLYILQIAGIGHINSFGLIYNDFMNDTHSTAKSLTTAHGVFGMMLAIGGMMKVLSKIHGNFWRKF